MAPTRPTPTSQNRRQRQKSKRQTNDSRTERSRSGRPSALASRSKLYERYDVDIEALSSVPGDVDGSPLPQHERPVEEWTNAEVCRFVWQNVAAKSRTVKRSTLLAGAALLAVLALQSLRRGVGEEEAAATTVTAKSAVVMRDGSGRTMLRPTYMDADAHARDNPFAPDGRATVMEGMLEAKRMGGRTTRQSLPELQRQHLRQQQELQEQQLRGQRERTESKNVTALESSPHHEVPTATARPRKKARAPRRRKRKQRASRVTKA